MLGLGYDKRIGQDFLRPGPGWGGSCFPKDTRALLKIADDAGYAFDLLEGVVAVNDEQFDRVTDKIVDGRRRRRRRQDDRRVGADVQGPHRRPAGVAVAGDHRAAARPRAPRCGRTTRRCAGPKPGVPDGDRDLRRPVRGRARAPTCWSCSPSGTTTAGSTPARSPRRWPGRAVVDARNLLDRSEWRRAGFELPGHRAGSAWRAIVVTGGAGFLGSHLCRALLDRGDQVVAVDNLVTGSVANIEELFGHRGFTFVEHDVSQYVWVPGHVDAVMHFASPASPIDFERIPIQILKVGGLGTHNCLGLAKAKGARFFLASTSEVYGDPQVHPQPETYWGHVNPIGPRGVYDEAKRFAEAMTMAYHRHHGLDVRIVRIFNSILADEQVLYDDGVELRRETVGELAARLRRRRPRRRDSVPGVRRRSGGSPPTAIALVGHPTTSPCFEVRTRYGRSIRVTGDHSLFVEGPDGLPVARTVAELVDRRPSRHRRTDRRARARPRHVSLVEMWDARGGDPWKLQLSWPGLGEVVWERRQELLGIAGTARPARRPTALVAAGRGSSESTAPRRSRSAEIRHLGIPIPSAMARVRPYTAGRAAWLPAEIELTEELLWLLGLWVAEGCSHESSHDAFLSISGVTSVLLRKAAKVFERDLGLHVVRQAGSAARAASIFVHSRLLLDLWEHLGFGGNRKRIPGWILGLPAGAAEVVRRGLPRGRRCALRAAVARRASATSSRRSPRN